MTEKQPSNRPRKANPTRSPEYLQKMARARVQAERDAALAAGLTVAEYRARRRAETPPTPTSVQVEPAPVAATLTPPPAGTPQAEAAGPVAVASSAPVSPAPEPEPTPVYPLADLLTWYGSAPDRAKAGTASPDERQPGCGEEYVLHGRIYQAWPVKQPGGWIWYLALDGT